MPRHSPNGVQLSNPPPFNIESGSREESSRGRSLATHPRRRSQPHVGADASVDAKQEVSSAPFGFRKQRLRIRRGIGDFDESMSIEELHYPSRRGGAGTVRRLVGTIF